jgi:hypothetical protein
LSPDILPECALAVCIWVSVLINRISIAAIAGCR